MTKKSLAVMTLELLQNSVIAPRVNQYEIVRLSENKIKIESLLKQLIISYQTR